jgi:hypothetical protein
MSCHYAKVSDITFGKDIFDDNTTDFFEDEHRKPFSSHTFNYYGNDGFCSGNGPYCGNIKAAPSVIFSIPATNSAGTSMEMTP